MKPTRLMLLLFLLPATLEANPFRTRYVCVPKVAPDRMALEFVVRDKGQCAEGDRYLEVLPQSDGSILLLPVQDLLSPGESRDFERYRRYFGGETGAPN